MEKKHLSWSQISEWEGCGEHYRLSRIERLRRPFSPAGFVGSRAHDVFEVNYRQKIESGNDLPEDELTDRFVELWKTTCECGHNWGDHDPEHGHCMAMQRGNRKLCSCENYRHGVPLLDWRFEDEQAIHNQAIAAIRAHRRTLAPYIQPASVEEEFRISLGESFPYDLLGYMDVVTVEGDIVDLKFYSAYAYRKLPQEIDNDGQLDLYAVAYRVVRSRHESSIKVAAVSKPTGQARLVLAKPKSNELLQWRLRQVQEVGRSIAAGVYPLREDTWRCSSKWCQYWMECRGKVVDHNM